MRSGLAKMALVVLTVAPFTACSSGEPTSCANLVAQIAELETPPASSDPSWDSIQATTERAIERDALRSQLAEQGCQ
jgi:hypothetical protein